LAFGQRSAYADPPHRLESASFGLRPEVGLRRPLTD